MTNSIQELYQTCPFLLISLHVYWNCHILHNIWYNKSPPKWHRDLFVCCILLLRWYIRWHCTNLHHKSRDLHQYSSVKNTPMQLHISPSLLPSTQVKHRGFNGIFQHKARNLTAVTTHYTPDTFSLSYVGWSLRNSEKVMLGDCKTVLMGFQYEPLLHAFKPLYSSCVKENTYLRHSWIWPTAVAAS